MTTKRILLSIAISLCVSCIAFADRTLDRSEILELFDKLTNQPKKTWISAGTIEAIHDEYRAAKTTNEAEISNQINQEVEEYKNSTNKGELTEELQSMKLDAIPFNVRYELSNEYSMNSHVVLKYDGEKFYWEISVNSRTDSVTPDKDLQGNFMTDQFDMDWNAERAFVWDGQKFTFYSITGNQSIVDAKGSFPHIVNGPLTAGVIPWGYGRLTSDKLAAYEASAVEVDVDGGTEIHLTLNDSDNTKMLFILVPEKDCAVLSCLFTGQDSIIAGQYDNFKQVSGNWIPNTILIEKYDDLANDPLASDLWMFTNISSAAPAADSFQADYKVSTLVEYHSLNNQKTLIYQYADTVDIERFITDNLAFTASEDKGDMRQNCATVALESAARQLGKDIANQPITHLVSGTDKSTNLYEMKQFVQSLGFNARVVKTDIDTLRNLSGCKVIVHLPEKNHFVMIDHIDNRYVWIFDLTSNKFFYSTDINSFVTDWTEGTALLISRTPIELKGNTIEIADASLHSFVGADGYTCTDLIQEYNVIFCDYVMGLCAGKYEMFLTRYGCEAAESGTCSYSIYTRKVTQPCVNDPYYPMHCTISGGWTWYYMYACK